MYKYFFFPGCKSVEDTLSSGEHMHAQIRQKLSNLSASFVPCCMQSEFYIDFVHNKRQNLQKDYSICALFERTCGPRCRCGGIRWQSRWRGGGREDNFIFLLYILLYMVVYIWTCGHYNFIILSFLLSFFWLYICWYMNCVDCIYCLLLCMFGIAYIFVSLPSVVRLIKTGPACQIFYIYGVHQASNRRPTL